MSERFNTHPHPARDGGDPIIGMGKFYLSEVQLGNLNEDSRAEYEEALRTAEQSAREYASLVSSAPKNPTSEIGRVEEKASEINRLRIIHGMAITALAELIEGLTFSGASSEEPIVLPPAPLRPDTAPEEPVIDLTKVDTPESADLVNA